MTKWTHVKTKKVYEIKGFAIEEKTMKPVVRYSPEFGDGEFTRPCEDFFDGRFRQHGPVDTPEVGPKQKKREMSVPPTEGEVREARDLMRRVTAPPAMEMPYDLPTGLTDVERIARVTEGKDLREETPRIMDTIKKFPASGFVPNEF